MEPITPRSAWTRTKPHQRAALKQRLERQCEEARRLAIDAGRRPLAWQRRVFQPQGADGIGIRSRGDATALCSGNPRLRRFDQRVLGERRSDHVLDRSLTTSRRN